MADFSAYKINNWFLEEPVDLGGVKIIQTGRYFCERGAVIPTALHEDFFEFTVQRNHGNDPQRLLHKQKARNRRYAHKNGQA